MLERGVPIDGVGLQMHLSLDNPPKPEDVAANISRLNKLGLEVQITELDVKIHGNPSRSQVKEQARIYAELLKICLKAKRCSAFIMWGFTDAHSSVADLSDGYDSALIFNKQYRPKPAYRSLDGVLRN